ncbi:MAG: HAD family phosphatase [Rhodospirillaceae bacterium]|nr:MAG: HAD family phosphatase [Rhodospirillaceae bacterium]
MTIDTVLFDIGNVLLQWDRRRLYRKLIADEQAMDRFLTDVCSPEWNEQQDAGRPIAEANAILCARFPEYTSLIEAFYARFDEMIGGEIDGMGAVVADLTARNVPLYGLSNWCAETFHHGAQYEIVRTLKDIVVSGREKVKKPDPRIFRLTIDRFRLNPEHTLFVDDVASNVAAGERLGLRGHLFRDADDLRRALTAHGLL